MNDLATVINAVAKKVALRRAQREFFGDSSTPTVNAEREAEALGIAYGVDDRKMWQVLEAAIEKVIKAARKEVRAKWKAEQEELIRRAVTPTDKKIKKA